MCCSENTNDTQQQTQDKAGVCGKIHSGRGPSVSSLPHLDKPQLILPACASRFEHWGEQSGTWRQSSILKGCESSKTHDLGPQNPGQRGESIETTETMWARVNKLYASTWQTKKHGCKIGATVWIAAVCPGCLLINKPSSSRSCCFFYSFFFKTVFHRLPRRRAPTRFSSPSVCLPRKKVHSDTVAMFEYGDGEALVPCRLMHQRGCQELGLTCHGGGYGLVDAKGEVWHVAVFVRDAWQRRTTPNPKWRAEACPG